MHSEKKSSPWRRFLKKFTESLRYQAAQLAIDLLLVNLSVYLGLFLRVALDEGLALSAMQSHLEAFLVTFPLLSAFYVLLFFLCGLHRVYWLFSTASDAIRVPIALIGAFAGTFLVEYLCDRMMPRLIYLLSLLLSLLFLLGFRVFLRVRGRIVQRIEARNAPEARILLVGAGVTGNVLLREFHNNPAYRNSKVVCIVDDDPGKLGKLICNAPVAGTTAEIAAMAEKYRANTIIFAISKCDADRRATLLSECMKTGCTVRTIPPVSSLIDGKVSVGNVRELNVEDLLGREPIRINTAQTASAVQDKVVMVTGGGGSIGSELCRQIASFAPKKLIILDIYENNAYDIQNELRRKYPSLPLEVRIASVRDTGKLERLFDELRPQVVYHAAAHKHVPLMEDAPDEAVKNNIFGTLNAVQMADRYGVERFVMISTDKAVNPTNVMGSTKRVCEMIVQLFNRYSDTDFVAVRFGNVLGSNGSVIPLFRKQIAAGGPVTVTHPDIIRYFMTIPEAVSLVLQAGATAKGGEIFVLDMGKPVRIVELAENLIRMSGLVPNVDIPIVFTGLRPGEKLFEELLLNEEGLQKTENSLIYIGKPIEIDETTFYSDLSALRKAAQAGEDVLPLLHKLVPTFHAPEQVNV